MNLRWLGKTASNDDGDLSNFIRWVAIFFFFYKSSLQIYCSIIVRLLYNASHILAYKQRIIYTYQYISKNDVSVTVQYSVSAVLDKETIVSYILYKNMFTHVWRVSVKNAPVLSQCEKLSSLNNVWHFCSDFICFNFCCFEFFNFVFKSNNTVLICINMISFKIHMSLMWQSKLCVF